MEEQEDFPTENVGRVYKKSDRSIVQVPTESVKFPPFFFQKIPPNEKEEKIPIPQCVASSASWQLRQ